MELLDNQGKTGRLEPGDGVILQEIVNNIKYPDGSISLSSSDAEAILTRKNLYMLVALDHGNVAGFAVGYRVPRIDRTRDMMNFYEIEVMPEHHRKGLGRALVESLKKICLDEGIMKMWVDTNVSNSAAVGLYQACGARPVSGDPIQLGWVFKA